MNPSSPDRAPEDLDLKDASAYAGRIRVLEPSRERGIIQARDGRQLAFHLGLVAVAGLVSQAAELRLGMPVTFDLSHGPNGPVVVKLWVGEGVWQTPTLPEAG